MEATRTFVAVRIGPPALEVLILVAKRLKSKCPQVRWSRADQYHLTLKFIGDIDNRELPELCKVVETACRETGPFTVQVQGLGTFPVAKPNPDPDANPRTKSESLPPKVVWAGAASVDDELQQLHTRLDQATLQLGVPAESRKFTPHITLGFVRGAVPVQELRDAIQVEQDIFSSDFEVEEVVLMESLRRDRQLVYEPIHTIPLVDS